MDESLGLTFDGICLCNDAERVFRFVNDDARYSEQRWIFALFD